MVKKIKIIIVSLSVLIFSSFSMTLIQASSDVSYTTPAACRTLTERY